MNDLSARFVRYQSSAPLTPIPANPPDPDWGLIGQGGRCLWAGTGRAWHLRALGHRVVTLGEPVGPPDFAALMALGRTVGSAALIYRCGARTAAAARSAGWQVLRIGDEARIDPGRWTLATPARRQLRRKLHRAERAGLMAGLYPPGSPLPWADLTAVHHSWQARNGRERGFSMGQFRHDLLARQWVLTGTQAGRIVAFASIHAPGDIWGLDLMRHNGSAPDGTMHSLLATAIAMAAGHGARGFSLACVPEPALGSTVGRIFARRNAGLQQFKATFDPDWRPVYAASPSRLGLSTGLVAVLRATLRPRNENFRFDLRYPLCEATAVP